MEKMSKEQERRLLLAIDKAATLSKEGGDPNGILIKVANEYRLSAPEICRVVETYNKAKSVAFLKTASAGDRAKDFPIASSETVLEGVYKPVEKAASELALKDYASMEYSAGIDKAASEKQASDRWQTRRAAGSVWNSATQFHDLQKKVHSSIRSRYTNSDVQATLAIRKIASQCEYMHKGEMEKVARNIICAYGDERGNAFIGFLNRNLRFAKMPMNLEKSANAVIFPSREPYFTLSKIADLCLKRDMAKADLDYFEKEAAEISLEDIARAYGHSGMGDEQKGAPDSLDMQTAMPSEWNNYLRALEPKKLVYKLYLTDPVIGSYPLQDVMEGYNSIAQIDPQLALTGDWVKSQLRRYLAQGKAMDPFEIKNMLDAEKARVEGTKNYAESVTKSSGKPDMVLDSSRNATVNVRG